LPETEGWGRERGSFAGARQPAFSEMSLPEELEPLVAWLQQRRRPIRL